MSSCTENLQNYLSADAKSKLIGLLRDATDKSPSSLSQKALGHSQKSGETKTIASSGIGGFKARVGLPSGRIDAAGGLNLGDAKQKADGLKSDAIEVRSAVADFQSRFPDCALDPNVLQVISVVSSIDSKLDSFSNIATDKLNGEIVAAQSKITESTNMQSQANQLKSLFT